MEYAAIVLIAGASNEHHDALAQSDRLARQIVAAGNEQHAFRTDRLGSDACRDRQVQCDSGRGLRWGRTVHKLAGIATSGRVHGIDSSDASVMVSRRANKQLIEAGQVEIRHGSVSSLPFSDSEFDYYWPDLVADMKEVLRVLKPGGTLMILGGAYKGGRQRARNQRFAQLINAACQSRDELGDSSLRPAIQMFRSSRTIAGVGSVA